MVAELHAGDCFGEAALILQCPSPVSVTAASHWAKENRFGVTGLVTGLCSTMRF